MVPMLALMLWVQDAPRQVEWKDLPPGARLGLRAEAERRTRQTLPAVVVVGTSLDFARAVAAWTPSAVFPVLIDDGSARAGEDIARFVRAFEPERVVRWASSGDDDTLPATDEWIDDASVRRGFIEAALARACGVEGKEPGAILAHWKAAGRVPPGIVVMSDHDEAWTGGLALAALRGQPIAWATTRLSIDGALQGDASDELASRIEQACEATGLSWKGLGDDLDAVTLAINAPVKIKTGARGEASEGFTATTDRVGRHAGVEGGPSKGERWAWAGQIFGSNATSAYMAMSAYFLPPSRAWLFDSYPDEGEWKAFDATRAGEDLRALGVEASVIDAPTQGIEDWRRAVARPLDADLVLVNTKGMRSFFELSPGRGWAGDVPFLDRPLMVHFVHSFSCVQPGDRATIAGRWIERGAYAYVGAVHEPFLGAFIPTPALAARLGWGYAWGAAARVDAGPEWRVAVIGDPLATLGHAVARVPGEVPLDGAEDADEAARAAVKGGEFERAIRLLSMLGRDEDAARLGGALLRERPDDVTPAMAREMVMPAYRAGEREVVVGAMERVDAGSAEPLRDALWSACAPLLPGTRDERMVSLLRVNVRADQRVSDSVLLSRAIARVSGVAQAISFLEAIGQDSTDRREKSEIERAIRALRPGG